MWSARVASTEAEIAQYAAEDELAKIEMNEARSHFDKVKVEHEEKRAEYEKARGAAMANRIPYHRTTLKKEARAKLQQLEASYPGA